ncbi:MAG: SDR family NAD(P)-dependent oxidoreductase [Rhodobacteraceae bacterium]|nr:SDR family NAD(P)-dependent oxidoreductase [Paracoccaceae bacterium]
MSEGRVLQDEARTEAAAIGENDIAIVGMAAHLPGAADIAEFWDNLKGGIESIRRLSEAELLAAGESPARMRHPNFVPAAAPLDGFDEFDAEFFGFSPKEAAILDPQHRQFLETAWEALENAGHLPEHFNGAIGAYGGCGMGSYFYFNICSNPDLVAETGMFLLRHTGNDKDFLTTRLSHVLDLKGPSVAVQTACSTSLVAIHYACQSLLSGECDMALAGGVTIELPQGRGYVFEDGEILSPDGHCHAFDHRAQGTVFGSGAGVVALRRLADAMADGDHIWAVIKGTAINNDGAAKAGYLAPSVDGQAAAIAEAHAVAGVSADTIDYVECHGTGTYLGDPIEVAALTEAFGETTDAKGFCRIGSVKTNIGHLDTAAGVASVIKTALALTHRQIPATLNYEAPNPSIDFSDSPFRVNDRLYDWRTRKGPRRAGVNSLGVGGTNAHAVLEEAPMRPASEDSDWPHHVITLSGRSKAALDANAARLAAHLRAHPEQNLADIAWTLKHGRRAFEKRRVLVASSHAQAADLLDSNDPRRVFNHISVGDNGDVVFMFPGGGAQYAGMARDLYETEPEFREWMDRGLDHLQTKLDYDIRAIWLPEPGTEDKATERLKQPSVQLPLIMITEYALARLWMSWGVQPAALVGHSMGENTAACLAGVMTFEDCIGLVLLRGQLFDTVPAGGMLSVPLSVAALTPLLADDLDIAAVNAPDLTVVSGPQAALDAFAARLAGDGIECQRIRIDIAAHSRMLEPILERFGDYLRNIRLLPPEIPILSNRSGNILSDAEATSPDYWVRHLRGTVRFADCIAALADRPQRVFLEVGPGKALASLVQAQGNIAAQRVLGSLRHPDDDIADDVYFMETLGRLDATGISIDWDQIWGEARRLRVPLPTYAFQRARYFIEPGQAQNVATAEIPVKLADIADWGNLPVWRKRPAGFDLWAEGGVAGAARHTWLMLLDDGGLGDAVAARLREAGHDVIGVRAGDRYAHAGEDGYVLAPERGREGYDRLIQDLQARGCAPDRVVSFWLATGADGYRPGSNPFHRNQEQGFYSLLFLAQAIAAENLPKPIHLTAITTGMVQVRAEALPHPEKATILGPLGVIPQELPGITCAALDIELPEAAPKRAFARRDVAARDLPQDLVDRVLEDLLSPPANCVAAFRGEKRFERGYRRAPLAPVADDLPVWRKQGVYLITGGFGGIGLTLAEDMIARADARVILLSRDGLPPREDWDAHIRHHGPFERTSQRIARIRRLEQAGGKVLVLAADVSNIEDMRAALARADKAFGAINGVIHAAGVIDDGPLLAKGPGGIEDVFTPKIHGTQVLDQLFPDGSLDWLVLFSSSSTVTTPAGQVDYIAANAYLNAFARSRAGGVTKVLALNWGVWNEVGMAAEAMAARTGAVAPGVFEPTSQPLLDRAGFDRNGHRLFTTDLNAAELWLLDEHRTTSGEAILPGTGYLELAAEALAAQGETAPFEIRDLLFLRPLHVGDGESREMRLRLKRSDAGYDVEWLSETSSAGRKAYQLHAQAVLAPLDGDQPERLDLAAARARCPGPAARAGETALATAQEAHLAFGPRWQVLRETALGKGEGIARLTLPLHLRGDLAAGYSLHPGLLDIATGWAMALIDGYSPEALWVPMSYRAVRLYRALPADITSWVRNAGPNRASGGVAVFDVTITDADGNVCVEVEGFSIKRLDQANAFAKAPPPLPAELEFDDKASGAGQPLSAVEQRLHYNISQGIQPSEGAEAFARALASGVPEMVVSSLDLDLLAAQARAANRDTGAGAQKFERPALDSDYAAPTNDIERVLAGFWQELLGIEQVGIHDSFFDLGGHSLIAVRLFAMVRKAYRIEFPISVLFEAPTIAACAAMIVERGVEAGPGATGKAEKRKQARPKRRFTHLVAMHEGEGGPKPPFFLVAGMFGNVLNLRHLAHLLGTDRPFYGLQARGLYGEEQPHRSMVEAARDYIAEMRVVQPKGPYFLGGFSGGGITAYEIAQQLEQAGESVAMLAMLDSPLPVRRPLRLPDRLLIKAQEIRQRGPGYIGMWLNNRIRWELAKVRGNQPIGTANDETSFHNEAIEAAFLHAASQYAPRPWDGPLTLFRPPMAGQWQVSNGQLVNSERAYVLHDNDWSQFVPGMKVVEVPGDHDSMVLEPNVRVLARRMQSAIHEAEARIARNTRPPMIEAAE